MFNSLKAKFLAVAGVVCASLATFAQEGSVTLPETGVDIAQYASSGITILGGVVGVCVGGCIAFMVVRFGIKWIRQIGRG